MLVQDNQMKISFHEQLQIITHRLSEAGLGGFNVRQNSLVCFAVDTYKFMDGNANMSFGTTELGMTGPACTQCIPVSK